MQREVILHQANVMCNVMKANVISCYRSQRMCSIKKLFLKISQYSQKNTCVGISFLIKVAGLMHASLLKKRLWHRRFPVNFTVFKNTFFIEHLFWLPVIMYEFRYCIQWKRWTFEYKTYFIKLKIDKILCYCSSKKPIFIKIVVAIVLKCQNHQVTWRSGP